MAALARNQLPAAIACQLIELLHPGQQICHTEGQTAAGAACAASPYTSRRSDGRQGLEG